MIFSFIVLLSSLVHATDQTKCLFLDDEPCMVIPTLTDMNPVELKYYSFMISLNNVPKVVMSYFRKDIFQKKLKI